MATLTVVENGKRTFVFKGTFEERFVPKKAGFYFHGESKTWRTDFADRAFKLLNYADEKAKRILVEEQEAKQKALEASRATDANVEIPAPEGLSYLPYQRAGIAYALSRTNTLIGDEMGLGKTIQAIGVVNGDPSIESVLVICPASLKINWERELQKWLVRPLSIEIANGKFPESDIVVVNYDVLKKHHDAIQARKWDLLIVDECHYIKNEKAQRTQYVIGNLEAKKKTKNIAPIQAGRKIFLTGTPLPNRPKELWTTAHFLAPEAFANFLGFAKRYCNAHHNGWGWDFSGASNLPELQEKLRSTILIRRLKADVLKELPAKRRQVIELPPNGASGALKREQAAVEAAEADLEAFRIRVELAKASDRPEDYTEAVEALKSAQSVAFGEISKARHEVALAKVPYVIAHIQDTLEAVDKVVVFAHHHDVVNQIKAEFGDAAVTVTGATPLEARQAAVDRFQTDPTCKVFIGNILAAGVGLTLTAASHVIFAELDWVPGNLTQAEDRCHRIGQTDSVLVQHLVLEGSLDSRIVHTLVEKQENQHLALDEKVEPEKPFEVIEVPAKKEAEAATKRTCRDQIAEDAARITDEQVELVHQGLQTLSAYCDGAQDRDGYGFSKIDVALGHALAQTDRLTKKQAALGRYIVLRYKRQLSAELVDAIRELRCIEDLSRSQAG